MPLSKRGPRGVQADQPTACEQSKYRTSSLRSSFNSIGGPVSVASQMPAHHCCPVGEAPRPALASHSSRAKIPEAAIYKPEYKRDLPADPVVSRPVSERIKDTCAYCGLAYGGCTTAVTYPLAGATGLVCGFLGCVDGCFDSRRTVTKGTVEDAKLGAQTISYLATAAMCVPCIAGPSASHLKHSKKLSPKAEKTTLRVMMPQFLGKTGDRDFEGWRSQRWVIRVTCNEEEHNSASRARPVLRNA